MSAHRPLVIIGGSGRAAAYSARRAGFAPHIVDLFGDQDTLAAGPTIRLTPDLYPTGLPGLARLHPPGPLLYAGALENHPEVIAEVAKERRVLGMGAELLSTIRRPGEFIQQVSVFAGTFPLTYKPGRDNRPPGVARWIRKPDKSAGGLGVRDAVEADHHPFGQCNFLLQEFITGEPHSAIFFSEPGQPAELLGVTQQLIGCEWLHAPRYQYAGNILLPNVEAGLRAELALYAELVAPAMELVGLWGMDFILTPDGIPYAIELNPRYTAAAELVEWQRQEPLLARQAATFGEPVPSFAHRKPLAGVFGKAIYYAPHALEFPAEFPWDAAAVVADPWHVGDYADIPLAGTISHPGDPVLTLFAHAATVAACEQQLRARATDLDRRWAATRSRSSL
ncbi:MAG: ATP-grasp domain-containing protein [Gemmataceae bacterium]